MSAFTNADGAYQDAAKCRGALLKIVAQQEISGWCLEHAVIVHEQGLHPETSIELFIALEIPTASDEQLLLTRDLLVGVNTERQNSLLWITARGVWNDPPTPIGEMMIGAIRLLGTGERVTLETSSATLLGPNEDDFLQMSVFHCIIFRWDAWLAPQSGRCTIHTSHDGLIWIESADWDTHNGMIRQLRRWKPKAIEKQQLRK